MPQPTCRGRTQRSRISEVLISVLDKTTSSSQFRDSGERLQLYRSCPQGAADGPGRGRAAAARVRRYRAHSPGHPARGRRCGGRRIDQSECGLRGRGGDGQRNGQGGKESSQKSGAAVYLASQKDSRVRDERGSGTESLVRRDRASPARGGEGGEGNC